MEYRAPGETIPLLMPVSPGAVVHVQMRAAEGGCAVSWRDLHINRGGHTVPIGLEVAAREPRFPPPVLPALRPAIEQTLVEWDWRMQDGIGTERSPSTYAAAIKRTLDRGDALLADLESAGVAVSEMAVSWQGLREGKATGHGGDDRSRTRRTALA